MKKHFIKISFFICFGIFVFLATRALADTIKLMSGKVVEGKVVEKTEKYLKIEREGKIITIPIKMIDDGTKKRRLPWIRRRAKANSQGNLSVRERLRQIREAEYRDAQSPENDVEKTQEDNPSEKTEVEPAPPPEDNQADDVEYKNTQKFCRGFDQNIIQCPYIKCRQQHPKEQFIVEHFFKGFYSPDGSKNKCNYHQSIPGKKGDVIDCFFDSRDRQDFIRSVANGGSPVYSENTFLQQAIDKGVCFKTNITIKK